MRGSGTAPPAPAESLEAPGTPPADDAQPVGASPAAEQVDGAVAVEGADSGTTAFIDVGDEFLQSPLVDVYDTLALILGWTRSIGEREKMNIREATLMSVVLY